MRKNSWKGSHALTLVVLTAAVSLSGRVEAQQTGLLPLAPIRRQRVPCDREDPTIKVYKQQYYGYHPTYWHTFPAGWGSPSGEGPNRQKSFEETPLGKSLGEDEVEMAPEGRESPFEPRKPAVPNIPQERDPFVTDEPGGAMPGATPVPRGNTPPRTTNPPAGERPFDQLDRNPNPNPNPNPGRGASNAPSRTRSRAGSAPAAAGEGTPELSAPAAQPAQGSAYRSGRRPADDDVVAGGDDGPLLGLTDADIARADDAGDQGDGPSNVTTASTPGSSSTGSAAAAAPAAQPRRRIFGNLFSSLGANWTRR